MYFTKYELIQKVLNDPNTLCVSPLKSEKTANYKSVEQQVDIYTKKFETLLAKSFKSNPQKKFSEYALPSEIGILIFLEVRAKHILCSSDDSLISRSQIINCILNNKWRNFDVNQLTSFFSLYYSYDGWSEEVKTQLEYHQEVVKRFINYFNQNKRKLKSPGRNEFLSKYTKLLITSFDDFSKLEIFNEIL